MLMLARRRAGRGEARAPRCVRVWMHSAHPEVFDLIELVINRGLDGLKLAHDEVVYHALHVAPHHRHRNASRELLRVRRREGVDEQRPKKSARRSLSPDALPADQKLTR